MWSSCSDELSKIAKTRYEKEIGKGLISREALVPGSGTVAEALGEDAARRVTRENLRQPASRGAEEVSRKRRLAGKMYENALKTRAGVPSGYRLQEAPLPQLFAGTDPLSGTISTPRTSGRYLRSLSEKPVGAALGGFHGVVGEKLRGVLDKTLPAAAEVDPTMTHATLKHEIGEVGALSGKKILPFASHAGVEPILRENIALKGDPAAKAEFQLLRKMHPEDDMAQRAIRQAGGTPDAPLAVGGRQQRAVEKILKRKGKELSPATKKRALMTSLLTGKEIGFDDAPQPTKIVGELKKTVGALKQRRFRDAAEGAKHVGQGLGRVRRYLKG